MRKSDFLLAVLVVVFLGLGIWLFATGRFDSLVGTTFDEVWDSIEGMLRPVFRR